VGNGTPGTLVLKTDKDGKLTGNVYGEPIEGEYNAANRQVVFRRIWAPKKGVRLATQVYTGTFSQDGASKPTVYKLVGTFQALDKGWGQLGVNYPWSAETGPSTQAPSLRQLQGRWRVQGGPGRLADGGLPPGTHLDEVGATLDITGNEVRRDGKMIATLAGDLAAVADMPQPATRRVLLITLPDGRAILCAYRLANEQLQIVYPHEAINRGAPTVSLVRVAKTAACPE
jgi:hypothetical protein